MAFPPRSNQGERGKDRQQNPYCFAVFAGCRRTYPFCAYLACLFSVPVPFHFDLYALVIAAGAAQALLLVFALAARRLFRVNSFCFFAAFLLSLTCILAFSVLYYNGYALAHPHLLRVHHPVNFLAAPLFFLFVKSVARQHRLNRAARHHLHYLPEQRGRLRLCPRTGAGAGAQPTDKDKLLMYARQAAEMVQEIESRGLTFSYAIRLVGSAVRQQNGWRFGQLTFSYPYPMVRQ